MKHRYSLLFIPAVFVPLALIAQGPLTPPAGAPAPTMKTLQQVEPRIDVATLTGDGTSVFLITTPGSYFLSGNVSVPSGRAGVAISAADVELDLGGFTITGAAGAVRGVELRGNTDNVRVRHGNIAGFAAGPGVGVLLDADVDNVQVTDLTIRNCAGGLVLGTVNSAKAENVSVTGSTSIGIDLATQGIRGTAHRCTVDNSSASVVSALIGIRAGSVIDCQVTAVTNTSGQALGISGGHTQGCTVSTINGAGNETAGIFASDTTGCRVSGVNTSTGANVRGIQSTGHVSDCTVSGVGSAGPAGAIGITGGTITASHVSGVGNGISASAIGILGGSGAISQCTAADIGDFNMAGQCNAISGGQISHCRVNNTDGRAGMLGITGSAATHCSVQGMAQSGAATSGSVTGIAAQHIVECQVRDVKGTTSSNTLGFSSYYLASHCAGSEIENSGTGTSIGFQAATGGQTVESFYTGDSDIGILCGNGVAVRGCTVTLGASGTGISATGNNCVIDTNAVRNCANGIYVTGGNGFVVRNRMNLCASNLFTSASSQGGPLISATGSIASTNPWANFTD